MIATRTLIQPGAEFPKYLVQHLHTAMSMSGYPLGFHHDPAVGRRYGVHLGDKDHPIHIVEFPADQSEHQLHYLLSAAEQIIRMWSVPPHRRMMPAKNRLWLPHNEHEELSRAHPECSESELARLSHGWYESVMGIATSVPIALRIEEDLSTHFPEHRCRQEAFVRQAIASLDEFINPEIAAQPPLKAARAIVSLASVHVERLSATTGIEPGPKYKEYADAARMAPLLSIHKENRLIGFYGDVWLTNAWARILGIRRWYKWERLK